MRRVIFWKKDPASDASVRPRRRALSLKQSVILFAFVFILSASGALYIKRNEIKSQFLAQSVTAGFGLQKVDVNGRNHTSAAAVIEAISVTTNTALFSLDLPTIRANLTQLSWVEDARVERHFPNTLIVTLRERVPMALLQTDKGHQLIDASGALITDASADNFTHLPVISGAEGAATKATFILDILQTEPELFTDVWAVHFVSGRRWDVHMRSGLVVKLPERDPALAWSRLSRLETDTKITARDLAAIDLRIPDQLIVEPNIPVRGKGSKT